MDWKKEWNENRFGILSVISLLLFPLFVFIFAPYNSVYRQQLDVQLLSVLIFALPILGIVFLALSFLKKEKNSQFRQASLAIIALLAVLILLLSILCCGESPPRTQPVVGASDALKEASQNHYLLETSQQSVTFTKDTSITRKAIIDRSGTGLSENQLCLSLGDYSGGSNFGGDTSFIRYNLGGKINVKFSALCVPGEEMLSQLGENSSYPQIKTEWTENCECVQDPALAGKTCCLVMLRYAT